MKYYIYTFITFLAVALIILNYKYAMNLNVADEIIKTYEYGIKDLTSEQKEEQNELLKESLKKLGYKNIEVRIIEEHENNKIVYSVKADKYKYVVFSKQQLSYTKEISIRNN